MNRLTLVIPGLLWPRPVLRDTVFDLRLPAFEWLLGRARRQADADLSPAAWWRERFGLDDLPAAAPLRLIDLGHNPGEFDWLCADPVHVGLDAQGMRLSDPARLGLEDSEAVALHAALAPLFAEFGELQRHDSHVWHLRLTQPSPAFAADLDTLLAHPGAALLPSGEAARPWRRLLNEAQMALHAHPVNQAREAAGRLPINSVALWGGGHAPSSGRATCDRLFSADPVIRGLGRNAGVAAASSPAGFVVAEGDTWAHLDDLQAPGRARDALAWRSRLQMLEQNWLAPALDAYRSGSLKALELVGFGDAGALTLALSPGDRWKFWRGPQPLEQLVP